MVLFGADLISKRRFKVGQQKKLDKKIKLVNLALISPGYCPVLSREDNWALRSGAAILLPKTASGQHSTEEYEEVIVVIGGEGTVQGFKEDCSFFSFQVQRGMVVCLPSHTRHNVLNTGKKNLEYVYVVAKTEEK